MLKHKGNRLFLFLFLAVLCIPFTAIHIKAATNFTLDDGTSISSVIYANHKYRLHTRGISTYYTSSNTRSIVVDRETGRLLVKEPGTSTITARSRQTGRIVCQKTFTVLRRADYITVPSRSLSLTTGDNKIITAKKSPSTSTDVLRFRSNNPKVASVNYKTGQLKAVGVGLTHINIYSKSKPSTSYRNKYCRTLSIRVEVHSSLSTAKQTEANKLQLTFQDAPTNLKPSDFTVKSTAGRTVSISSVSPAAKTVTLTLGQRLLDGKDYIVQYHSSSARFTASDGIIKTFKIKPEKAAIKTEVTISASAYDKNGMFLQEYTYGNNYTDITFTVLSSALKPNKTLYFTSIYETAYARIYYSKIVNGVTTSIIADSGSVKISAYDAEMLNAQYRCTLTNDINPPFTSTSTPNFRVPCDYNTHYAHFQFTTSMGKEISDYTQYRFESSNTNILLLSQDIIYDSSKYIQVIPIKQGSCSILVKNLRGEVLCTFPVTVSEASKLTTVKPSKNYVYLDNTQTITDSLDIIAYDQYNCNLNNILPYSCYLKCSSVSGNNLSVDYVNNYLSSFLSSDNTHFVFYGYDLPRGTYSYQIVVNDKIYSTITVIINGKDINFIS